VPTPSHGGVGTDLHRAVRDHITALPPGVASFFDHRYLIQLRNFVIKAGE